jgi:hypothetical protein
MQTVKADSVILDPTCGAGDLLLACTHFMAARATLSETIATWSEQLAGLDIHREFVATSKLRLLLAARGRITPSRHETINIASTFSGIVHGSAFEQPEELYRATHIALNPPFTLVPAPDNCEWGHGRVNAAALFAESCIVGSRTGTRVIAILPDVLRSGSRYAKWRQAISQRCSSINVRLAGRFDPWTNVHVFVFNGVVGRNNQREVTSAPTPRHMTIADIAKVCVGPVVDYRDPQCGPWLRFINAKSAPPWGRLDGEVKKRRFTGASFFPPFVVVRRTSRPGDRWRAVATIVGGSDPVAVENHLLVIDPFEKTYKACKHIMRTFKHVQTTGWLDHRIRCRHLTVDALKSVPLLSEGKGHW